MSVTREPFDAFEVRLVGEFADPRGDENYMQPIDSQLGLEDAEESGECLGYIYTVYGLRDFPDELPGDTEGYGATAISDFVESEREAAVALAYALAAGKPVYDRTNLLVRHASQAH